MDGGSTGPSRSTAGRAGPRAPIGQAYQPLGRRPRRRRSRAPRRTPAARPAPPAPGRSRRSTTSGGLGAPAGQPRPPGPPRTAGPGRPAGPRASRPRTWRAPCSSISSSTGTPGGQPLLDRAAGGAVAVAGELRPLQHARRRRPARRTRSGETKWYFDPVDLPRPRRAGRRRHRQPDLRVAARRSRATTVLLPTPDGPGQHDEAGQATVSGDADVRARRGTRVPARRPGGCRGRATRRLAAIADPLHDLPGPDLADAGHRLQQRGDPHLADRPGRVLAVAQHGRQRGRRSP